MARMRGKSLCGEREAEPATDKTAEQPDYRVRVPQRLITTASFAWGKRGEDDGRKLLRKAKVSHPPSRSMQEVHGGPLNWAWSGVSPGPPRSRCQDGTTGARILLGNWLQAEEMERAQKEGETQTTMW